MSIFILLLQFALTLVLFLFFFWRALHEDFASTTIFRSGLIITFGFALGGVLFSAIIPRFFPQSSVFSHTGLWFWGAVVGLTIAFSISQKVFSFPFYETLEAAVVGFLVAMPILSKEWLASVLTLLVYIYLKNKYKTFAWYKSGKVGFAGLSCLGIFFLIRALLALTGSSMLVFTGIGKVEVVVCAALAFLAFFAVYNLSETKS